ncbi:MAG: hypothetical protein VB017_05530 [Endomicrobiaceae bacterium]|nr:hypothetical protein [Endomicrobiaceae bacterium]
MVSKYLKKIKKINKLPIKYKYQDATVLFKNNDILKDYLEFERTKDSIGLDKFCKNERLILFCHYKLGWGRKQLRRRTGLTEHFIRKTLKSIQNRF